MRTTTLTYEGPALETHTAANVVAFARNVALFAAAPFIGLAYALAFPLVGAVALAWLAVKTLAARKAA